MVDIYTVYTVQAIICEWLTFIQYIQCKLQYENSLNCCSSVEGHSYCTPYTQQATYSARAVASLVHYRSYCTHTRAHTPRYNLWLSGHHGNNGTHRDTAHTHYPDSDRWLPPHITCSNKGSADMHSSNKPALPQSQLNINIELHYNCYEVCGDCYHCSCYSSHG